MTFQIRIFTAQLAVADIIFGIFVMARIRRDFISVIGCQLIYNCIMLTHLVTTLTITAMSCDRFLALCWPFKYPLMVTSGRLKLTSALIWIIALSMSLITLVWWDPDQSTGCTLSNILGREGSQLYAVLYVVVLLLNAAFVIGILRALFLAKHSNSALNGRQRHMEQQKRILTKVLGILCLFCVYIPAKRSYYHNSWCGLQHTQVFISTNYLFVLVNGK